MDSHGVSSARRAWLLQGGPRPRWRHLFTQLRNTAVCPSARSAAWSILQGTVVWGTQATKWSPGSRCCAHCAAAGRHYDDCAAHFAECPSWDSLWHTAGLLLETAGCGSGPVRRWFVLYGPESYAARTGTYHVALIIWALLCRTMLRSRSQSRLQHHPKAQRAVTNEFIAALREECRADYSAATTWTPPLDSLHAPRRATGQSRDFNSWATRWQGLAQLQSHRVCWVTDRDYDSAAASAALDARWAALDDDD